ncbi:MAG: FAD-dependent thymidylate synthase [Candidatus Omnitrophica bacterium]|nr:FAD-dependent thymidylate synthase [Candidatus Omnitrophota bacterium]
MKVYLAGFNVDASVLQEMEAKLGKRDDITPEVLSAAYARISRDPRAINEIRQSARQEVEKSRKSNSTIIFKMGHHSVAEHAVFNFDILGVSRFAMEELEKFRLCSYTEKSQRYITLQDDIVVPVEIQGTKFEGMFRDMISAQNKAYFELYDKLKKHVFQQNAELALDPKNHNLLEGWAKEDARYITSLAAESQVGLTINARNLELLLRRFASHPLDEIKSLGKMLYDQVSEVAPSIVIFHQANDRDQKTYPDLKVIADALLSAATKKTFYDIDLVKLVDFTKCGDAIVSAALLHSASNYSYSQCRQIVDDLPELDVKKIFKAAWQNMQFYDSMLREFEYVNLTFDIVLSSACFGQLKRHRMSTITAQSYDPSLGITIPQSIKDINMDDFFQDIVDKTNQVYSAIKQEIPLAAPYILTNAHRKRIMIRVNAREMYHISRLREDAHAQWDIQNVSRSMAAQAKKVMPFVFACIGGKDKYNEIYKNIFGINPKIVELSLPGAREIIQEKIK